MNFRIESTEVHRIVSDVNYTGKFPPEVASEARRVVNLIAAVENENELYQSQGLRFKKLQGKVRSLRSVRLNRQYRLILDIEQHPGQNTNVCVIIDIGDFH